MNPVRPASVAEIRADLAAARGKHLAELIRAHSADPRAGVRDACVAAASRAKAALRETARTVQLYEVERSLRKQGFAAIAGVDEVGRGALAGPLTAAAVILPSDPHIEGLDDSKRLSPARREALAAVIHSKALSVGIAHIPATDIDTLGVTVALKRAIVLALGQLAPTPDHVVIDGLPLRIVVHETAIPKGDSKVAAISAASIVAKVARDALMVEYSSAFPEYGLQINKGYGTAEHIEAIARHGHSDLHRRSFCTGGGTMPLF